MYMLYNQLLHESSWGGGTVQGYPPTDMTRLVCTASACMYVMAHACALIVLH
jgi:hypothetical protein